MNTTMQAPAPAGQGAASGIRRLLPHDRDSALVLIQRNGLIIFFVALIVVFAMVRPEFLSETNIKNILQSASIIGILACGQTVIMLTGGFDLSVARTAVVGGMVVVLASALGPLLGIIVALLATALVGLINGTLIAKARVNPFVVTLGMYTMLGSFALLLNDGGSLSGVPGPIISLTSGRVFGLSTIVVWFALVALLCHLLLSHTRFGRQIYAVGGNFEAARLAGIRADRTLIWAYVICSLLAGFAGILLTARLQTASPVALPGVELDAIAAVIIGGTRMSGGFGSIPRTIVGVLVLTSLTSGLVILGVAAYWQGILKGAVIIAAVAVDVLFSKRR